MGAEGIRSEPAHDVLAAEEFAMPAPDPALSHGPVVLPDDPTGIAQPHDILAAEEFAMPAAGIGLSHARRQRGARGVVVAAAALAAFVLLRRLTHN